MRPGRALLLPRDQNILFALGNYYFLTSKQVQRLYYGQSLTWVQSHVMPRLVSGGYLSEIRPHASPADYYSAPGYSFVPPASLPIVYYLAAKGKTWLKKQGMEPPPYKYQDTTALQMRHSLIVNDFLIAAELLTREYEQIQIARMLHERDFRGRPVQPDGFLRLHIRDRSFDLVIEVDLGNEAKTVWQKKVKSLTDYVQGRYHEDFQATHYPTIAVLTPLSEKRRDVLRSWTAEVTDSDLFLFSSIDPRIPAAEVFIRPVWFPARIGQAQPLLVGGEGF